MLNAESCTEQEFEKCQQMVFHIWRPQRITY